MMLSVVLAAAFAIFWLARREKPLYSKTYYRTRSAGVFKTEYAEGFADYIAYIPKEVRARFTVGPIAPTDDRWAPHR
jgi:hypothetical protein